MKRRSFGSRLVSVLNTTKRVSLSFPLTIRHIYFHIHNKRSHFHVVKDAPKTCHAIVTSSSDTSSLPELPPELWVNIIRSTVVGDEAFCALRLVCSDFSIEGMRHAGQNGVINLHKISDVSENARISLFVNRYGFLRDINVSVGRQSEFTAILIECKEVSKNCNGRRFVSTIKIRARYLYHQLCSNVDAVADLLPVTTFKSIEYGAIILSKNVDMENFKDRFGNGSLRGIKMIVSTWAQARDIIMFSQKESKSSGLPPIVRDLEIECPN